MTVILEKSAEFSKITINWRNFNSALAYSGHSTLYRNSKYIYSALKTKFLSISHYLCVTMIAVLATASGSYSAMQTRPLKQNPVQFIIKEI